MFKGPKLANKFIRMRWNWIHLARLALALNFCILQAHTLGCAQHFKEFSDSSPRTELISKLKSHFNSQSLQSKKGLEFSVHVESNGREVELNVLDSQNELVGGLSLIINAKASQVEIEWAGFPPALQGEGLGSQLLKAVVDQLDSGTGVRVESRNELTNQLLGLLFQKAKQKVAIEYLNEVDPRRIRFLVRRQLRGRERRGQPVPPWYRIFLSAGLSNLNVFQSSTQSSYIITGRKP